MECIKSIDFIRHKCWQEPETILWSECNELLYFIFCNKRFGAELYIIFTVHRRQILDEFSVSGQLHFEVNCVVRFISVIVERL